jgi:serine/threonine protein kinase
MSDDAELRALVGRAVNERYLLRDLLGSGAFGGVYRSEQYVLGRSIRTVACKVSRRTGVSEQTAGSVFADVLQLAGAMEKMADGEAKHHLVHVIDGGIAGELDDRAFLAMEYVPGRSLHSEFAQYRDGRVPYRLLLKWARQIAVALRGLHGQTTALLHRDIKPDNVLLGTDGIVRLIDFGLAARMLTTGLVPGTAGTLQYMAPETAAGGSIPASDVYSLGLVMYEGLTGRHAYAHLLPPLDLPDALHGDWLLEQKQKSPVPRPSQVDDSVPPKLDELVVNCLALRPESRVRSAGEVIAAIDAILSPFALPSEDDLVQARQLLERGAAALAADAAERGLRHPRLEPPTRYALLCVLGSARASQGSHAEAAKRLAEAYEVVNLLRIEKSERCDLLARVEREFRAAGNPYQTERFAQLLSAERGRR